MLVVVISMILVLFYLMYDDIKNRFMWYIIDNISDLNTRFEYIVYDDNVVTDGTNLLDGTGEVGNEEINDGEGEVGNEEINDGTGEEGVGEANDGNNGNAEVGNGEVNDGAGEADGKESNSGAGKVDGEEANSGSEEIGNEEVDADEVSVESGIAQGDNINEEGYGALYVSKPQSIGQKYSLNLLGNPTYVINTFFTVPMSTMLLKKDVDIDYISTYDLTLKQNNSKPQILIYHTHSMEGFTDSIDGDDSTSIVGVGEYLAEILHKQFGYNVIHCTEKFDYVDGAEERSGAYLRARPVIEAILYKYPSIEVILDIHRDGVNEDVHLVTTVNGKPTAKIMFFNGLCRDANGDEIEYGTKSLRKENLAMSFRMKLLAEEYYPSLTRRNYVNSYHYNMNLKEKSMLIEVGAQTNTFGEAKNAMEPLAMLLSMILN